ncbi:MAG: alanine dehydrogenase [Bacteroidales bacterium]|nr:alanine dehydrogenase [Bacteroidales bacterium]
MISQQNDTVRNDKLLPREEKLAVKQNNKNLSIGVPKETTYQENRVPLTPEAVGLLAAHGNRVLIEADAGNAAHFSNNEYSEAGAEIVYSKKEVFNTDIIVKVAPPSDKEIDMMSPRKTIFSSLHIAAQEAGYFRKLMEKKMTAIAYELIRDKAGSFPVIISMSEIAGTAAVFIAAGYLSDPLYGKGVLFGGFPGLVPTEVIILGAGTVGEYAARASLGLGASVKVFDNSIYKLRRLQNILNFRIYTSVIHPGILGKALRTADVAIGAVHTDERLTPVFVTEDMVRNMKPGSVIIDVSIDQGGCFETSRVTNHNNPVFKKYDVTHYCVPNVASRVPNTASNALSNFFSPVLLKIGEEGGTGSMLLTNYGVRQGVYMYNGTITKPYIGEHFGLPAQDIELLMAALR